MSIFSTPDISIGSEFSLVKKRSRCAHTTWIHARPPRDGEPIRRGSNRTEIWYCKYCDWGTISTTSARKHLLKQHDIRIEASNAIRELGSEGVQTIFKTLGLSRKEIRNEVFKKPLLRKRALQEALVRLVVRHDLPFRAVTWPELHTLLQLVNPAVKPDILTSHSTLSSLIDDSWLRLKDLLRKRLQSAVSPIHLAADIWTSPNRFLFLGICIQFIDSQELQLKRVLLALQPVLTHQGIDQAAKIYQVLDDYGIMQKLGYFVGDNATSNDVLCRMLSQLLFRDGIVWEPV